MTMAESEAKPKAKAKSKAKSKEVEAPKKPVFDREAERLGHLETEVAHLEELLPLLRAKRSPARHRIAAQLEKQKAEIEKINESNAKG